MARPTELDLRDYGRILSRRKGWVIGSALAATVLAFGINAFTEPIYRATVRIHVQREPSRSPLTGEMTETPTSQSENLALYTAAELITNRKLLARVVESLHDRGLTLEGGRTVNWWARARGGDQRTASVSLSPIPVSSGTGAASRPSSVREIDALLQRISVEPVRDTRLVNIHVEHSDPRSAELIANAIADQFVEFQIDVRNAGSSHLIGYLAGQLQEVRENLRQAEQASAYLEARDERIAIEGQLAASREVNTSSGESSSRRRLMENEAELAKARKIYRDRHPKLVMLESENKQLLESLRNEARDVNAGVRARYNAALSRERSLAPAAGGRSAAVLQNELETQRELQAALMTKLKEAEITSQVRQPLVEVVEPATANRSPVRPRKALNLAVCLIAGLTVGTGLAFMREYLRRTIRTPQDVDDHLQLPVLGLIPKA